MTSKPTPKKMRLIALEEHFIHPAIAATYGQADLGLLNRVMPALNEIGDMRLEAMDAVGIDVQVLSHTKPGVHEMDDVPQATALAYAANDYLAEAVAAHPDRFAGFATLAPAAPADAARELERTVRQYGFKGAMLNGHTRGSYLDDRKYWAIFEAAQSLDVPIYLHPANPHPAVFEAYFKDYPVLGYAPWGYAIETGTHVLRLILSGLFDEFPRLKMVIGHMGELIPFGLWRADGRLTPKYAHLKKSVRNYFLDHFSVTTAGVFSTPELMCTASVIGYDNMLFSVDYPFESNVEGVRWFNGLEIAESDRHKLAHGNAERLLKL